MANMDQSQAATKADEILIALITNQPNFWPSSALAAQGAEQTVARRIASVRQTLIEELQKQPY
jgi:hypothetical protein